METTNKTFTMASTIGSVALLAAGLGLTTSLPWIFALMFSIAAVSGAIAVTFAAASLVSGGRAPVALHRTAPRRRAVV